MSGPALLYLLAALASLAAFAGGLTATARDRRLARRIAPATASTGPAPRRAMALPPMLAARGRDRTEVVDRLKQAGFAGDDAVQHFLWLRLAATAAVALLAALFNHAMWGGVFSKPLILFLLPALAYLAAKRALILLANARRRAVTAEFPFLLDLLLMMLESGISLDQCIRTLAREEAAAIPKLNRSLRDLVEDLDRGMGYEAALQRWAARLGVAGTRDLASLFLQSLFQGVELGPALRQFAREFTERRVAAAREAMGRISVKLVVVMIVFFMPALFIVVGGPPATSLFDTVKAMRQ